MYTHSTANEHFGSTSPLGWVKLNNRIKHPYTTLLLNTLFLHTESEFTAFESYLCCGRRNEDHPSPWRLKACRPNGCGTRGTAASGGAPARALLEARRAASASSDGRKRRATRARTPRLTPTRGAPASHLGGTEESRANCTGPGRLLGSKIW